MQTHAFSIDEFCKTYKICKTTYYNMKKDGTAPLTIKVRGRRLITAEAATEWCRKMERLSGGCDGR